MFKNLICTLAAAALCVACSDDTGNNNTQGDMTVTGDMNTSCGAGVYPCGPYGTAVDSVVANMELQGYMDAKEHCLDHKDKKQDTAALRKASFKDYHLGDSSCASMKRTLLWVMVSAGWCAPCQDEVKKVQAKYEKAAYDERNYRTIVEVAAKLPDKVIQEDEKLLMYLDVAQMRYEDVEQPSLFADQ